MEIRNHLPFNVDVRSAMGLDGYDSAALMVKATFQLPRPDQDFSTIAREQAPWVYADVLTGPEDNPVSLYEAELPYPKPHPEYLIIGSAHSPDGTPQQYLPCGISIGTHTKHLVATGSRQWHAGWLTNQADNIKPTLSVPLSHDFAFGGCDPSCSNGNDAWYEANLAGTGFCRNPSHRQADGLRLPQLEPMDRRFGEPCGSFPVVSFGPVGRNWSPRKQWAGTYDQEWRANVWPRLPKDFDPLFFQSASKDQWLPAIRAGEQVALKHLTPAQGPLGSLVEFPLPAMDFRVTVYPRRGAGIAVTLIPDTLVFEPEAERFVVIARLLFPVNEGLLDLTAVVFGDPSDPLRPMPD